MQETSSPVSRYHPNLDDDEVMVLDRWREDTERETLMSEHAPTLLIVSLHPDNEEGACYHIDETLTTAGVASTLMTKAEERVVLEGSAPFVLTHHEQRLVFALRTPLEPKGINDMAQLVVRGLLLGFVVKGEIALGGEVGVFTNLGE